MKLSSRRTFERLVRVAHGANEEHPVCGKLDLKLTLASTMLGFDVSAQLVQGQGHLPAVGTDEVLTGMILFE